jgi:hypothetical protein
MIGKGSRVFLHPDGYVEMVFVGIQEAESLQILITQAQALLNEHGPISIIVDGRHGRIQSNISNFSQLMGLGRLPNLIQLYILTSKDSNNVEAIQGPSVVTSILTSVLGFRPFYSSDEALIRRRASEDTGDKEIEE